MKRDNVELTSDFTATINADLKVGAIEETITVSAVSPIVDTTNTTTRMVMTREVLDALPTGRNIQAVGIMIPGTTLALGGGGALSRDVGGSGSLQQSPLQYRGSADTVQTVEGMRLNNLCANGAYSGVYWNDGSFQEFSYVTGADSAEMGQGGMRVNMVPKDGGNSFHGTLRGNYTPSGWASDNCGSPGIGQPCTRSNLTGDTTFNRTNNFLTNVSQLTKNYDFNPGVGGPIVRDKVWFYGTFRYLGVNKTVVDSFYDCRPVAVQVRRRYRAVRASTMATSAASRAACRCSGEPEGQDHLLPRRTGQGPRPLGHRVERPAGSLGHPGDADEFRVGHANGRGRRATGCCSTPVSRVYNQEYQENYQPDVFAGANPLVTINDNSTGKIAGAWNNPADHFSKLFTEQFAASLRHRFALVAIRRDDQPGEMAADAAVHRRRRNRSTTTPACPSPVTLRIPTDRRNSIKNDSAVFAQDKWTFKRATVNAGVRWDWFISATDPETLPASTWNSAVTYSECSDGNNNLNAGCTGRVPNWKDISPRVGIAYDLFGTGRTAIKASCGALRQRRGPGGRQHHRQQQPRDYRWRDRHARLADIDRNGSPYDANGRIQLNELTNSTSTPSFGKNIPSSTTTDPAVLEGWGTRGYNTEISVSGQHELAPRVSVSGGWFRRKFGNQTVTVDNRYSFAKGSYDGPFCANAPADPNLPGGGGYQVCGLYDLKPSVVAQQLPTSSTLQFSSNFGGETNIYEGFDFSTTSRFGSGAFLQRRRHHGQAHLRSVQPGQRRHRAPPVTSRRRPRSPRSSRTAPRPAIRISRIVRTSS